MALYEGNHQLPGDSHHKGPVMRESLVFYLLACRSEQAVELTDAQWYYCDDKCVQQYGTDRGVVIW